MKLTAGEAARLVGGKLSGPADRILTGVAPLAEAEPHDISFLAAEKYLKELPKCRAGLLLLKEGTPVPEGSAALFVDNPQFAFARILAVVAAEKEPRQSGIHASAVIDPSAKLGEGVSVGAHAVIEPGVSVGVGSRIGAQSYLGERSIVGKHCRIHPQVTLREEVRLGDRVVVHSGAVIGSDGFGYATVAGVHHKIPQIGTVEIEDDVEIGANVAIDRATLGKTVVGRGSKIDNLVQIAHNVKIGEGCILVAQAGVAGSSQLGRYVTLAGQVGVVGHITIGDQVIAAAQSGIPNDVPAGAVVFGSPARPIREERKIQAILSRLPEIYDDFRKMKKQMKQEEK